MFPELSPCVNGRETEYPFGVNSNESDYSITGESGNIYESGKISSSVNLVLVTEFEGRTVIYGPCFSPSKYGVSTNSADYKSGKTYKHTVQAEKKRSVRYQLHFYCVSDGFENDTFPAGGLRISDQPRR